MNTDDGIHDIKAGLIGILKLLRGITILLLSAIIGIAKWIQQHTEIGWQSKPKNKKH